MHAATRVLTFPVDEDVLDRAREDPDDEEGELAAQRPSLFRPSSPYLGQGFLEIQIAAQAPWHRTPSKVRKPTFPQGLPSPDCVGSLEKSAHRNLLCLRRRTEDQQQYIAVD